MFALPILFLACVSFMLVRSFIASGECLECPDREPAFAVRSRAISFARATGMRIAVRTRAPRNRTMMRLAFMKIANRLELDFAAAVELDTWLDAEPTSDAPIAYILAPRDLPYGVSYARIPWGV